MHAVELTTPGRVLGGRYRLVEPLAGAAWRRSGSPTTPCCRDASRSRSSGPTSPRDEATRARFRHEAIAAARLSHPNIVSTYDTGDDDGIAYIVMELVDGPTLRHLIDQRGGLPVRRGHPHRQAGGRRARRRPPRRARPPRREAGQRARATGRPGQGHRLRDRQGRRRRRPHPDRHRDGHRPLPLPRAGERATDRCAHRRVRARPPPLRVAAAATRRSAATPTSPPPWPGSPRRRRRSAPNAPRCRRRSTTSSTAAWRASPRRASRPRPRSATRSTAPASTRPARSRSRPRLRHRDLPAPAPPAHTGPTAPQPAPAASAAPRRRRRRRHRALDPAGAHRRRRGWGARLSPRQRRHLVQLRQHLGHHAGGRGAGAHPDRSGLRSARGPVRARRPRRQCHRR